MTRRPSGRHQATAWYRSSRHLYEALVQQCRLLLRSLLDAEKIPYVDIQGRCKTEGSFVEKQRRKKYKNPAKDMMDLAGLRVITLVESDIARVETVIKSAFGIRPENSVDKTTALESDRFGYRSLHLICDLGPQRTALPEFAAFKGLVFEVQVRTALQHAWAEIEHDRSYKLKGSLPSHLKRRFAQLASLLELADREFDELTRKVDEYEVQILERAKKGDFADIELNSSSIREMLTLKLGDVTTNQYIEQMWPELISELKAFGVATLADLDQLLTPKIVALCKRDQPRTIAGVLRDAMILSDPDKYFNKAWQNHWQAWDISGYERTVAVLGREYVDGLTSKFNLVLDDEQSEQSDDQ